MTDDELPSIAELQRIERDEDGGLMYLDEARRRILAKVTP